MRNLGPRLQRIEAHISPKRPAWKVAWEEHERRSAEMDAHFAAFVAEHYPDGLPVVDESALSEAEKAEQNAVLAEMRADCMRAEAEVMRYEG